MEYQELCNKVIISITLHVVRDQKKVTCGKYQNEVPGSYMQKYETGTTFFHHIQK